MQFRTARAGKVEIGTIMQERNMHGHPRLGEPAGQQQYLSLGSAAEERWNEVQYA